MSKTLRKEPYLKKCSAYYKPEDFPMHELEQEYDYASDEEQVYTAKKHMINEGLLAIEFFTKDDPLVLVENLNLITEPK